MARLLQQFVEPIDPCPYLPDQRAQLETRILLDVSVDELEHLLVRGWRRFGPQYFRPVCAACAECVSIRVPVATFKPSKSQRRAQRNCASLRVVAGPPRVDEDRLALYHRWHRAREQVRGWPSSPLDARTYQLQFAFPHPAALELAWYDDSSGTPRLVGLSICDRTRNCLSAVYFFYDPSIADRSPGIANVLFQIEYARQQGIPHLYLGFRVLPCPSMRYKQRYRPHELLVGPTHLQLPPQWVLAPDEDE